MTIDPVTSLAHLEYNAKINKYYQQLAKLGCAYFGYGHIKTFPQTLEKLYQISKETGDDDCSYVIKAVNYGRNYIRKMKNPIVVELEKKLKKTTTRKKVRKIIKRVTKKVDE